MSTFKTALLTAKVTVVPPPQTALHTAAILKKLSTYGNVISFTQQILLDKGVARYEFHCESKEGSWPESANREVEVDFVPPHPDPEGLDFYDVFGYKDRHYPPQKSFHCVLTKSIREPGSKDGNTFSALVRHPGTDALHEDLYWSNVPAILRHGLSLRPHRRRLGAEIGPKRLVNDREPIRPMALYREAMRRRGGDPAQKDNGLSEGQTDVKAIPERPKELSTAQLDWLFADPAESVDKDKGENKGHDPAQDDQGRHR